MLAVKGTKRGQAAYIHKRQCFFSVSNYFFSFGQQKSRLSSSSGLSADRASVFKSNVSSSMHTSYTLTPWGYAFGGHFLEPAQIKLKA